MSTPSTLPQIVRGSSRQEAREEGKSSEDRIERRNIFQEIYNEIPLIPEEIPGNIGGIPPNPENPGIVEIGNQNDGINNQRPPISINDRNIPYETKLLDMAYSDIPVLYVFGNCFPVTRFKDKIVIQLRRLFTQILEDLALNPQSEKRWKQFFLLPYIFFTTKSVQVQQEYLTRLQTDDGWNVTISELFQTHRPKIFRASTVPPPTDADAPSTEIQLSKLHRSVQTKVQRGRLSNAMDRLTATSDTWNPAAAITDLRSSQVEQTDLLRVNEADVRSIVADLADATLPGVDLFSGEHLKLFMGTSFSRKDHGDRDADEKRFTDAYTTMINIVLSGSMPWEVSACVRSNLLLALPKSKEDIRPIGVGLMVRKIVSKLLFKETIGFNRTHFRDYQYALKSSGMEEVVHSINLARSVNPDWDTFSIDADNAFNSANKMVGLKEIYNGFPKAFPLVRQMYLGDSQQFFIKEGVIKVIPSIKGFHQGDVLGTWCYIITIQPLLRSLAEHLEQQYGDRGGDKPLILFYVDDGNICGPHDVLMTAIRYLMATGPIQYGYRIKPTKGAYLIGKCATSAEAVHRYHQLTSGEAGVTLGLDIVKIHPANLVDADVATLPAKYTNMTVQQQREDYGMKVLGAYIGTNEYVKAKLRGVLADWAKMADRLIAYPIVQHRMLLFRYCFNPKPVHLLRTIARGLTGEFVTGFMGLQIRVLNSMAGCVLPDNMMNWFCLPIDRGGLSILNYNDVHGIAHLASVFGSKGFREGYMETYQQSVDHIATLGDFFRELHDGLTDLKTYLGLPHHATDDQVVSLLDRISSIAKKADTTFQSELYMRRNADRESELELEFNLNPLMKCHYKSLINDTSGKWLQVFPRYKDLEISNSDFSIGFCFRYLLDIPLIREDREHCPFCRKQGFNIDKKGHHFVSGCSRDVVAANGANLKAQRHATHDHVRHALFSCCKHAMTYAMEEPANMFIDADNRTRPDLKVAFSKNMVTTTFALDLTIVSPFEGTGKGDLKVSNPDHPHLCDVRAVKAAADKTRKYKLPCQQRHIEFVPFVMYTTGKLHDEGYKFLERMAAYAEERRKVPKAILMRYYLKILSVCLIRRIGYTIASRATASFSRNYNVREAYRQGNELAVEVGGSRVMVRRAPQLQDIV